MIINDGISTYTLSETSMLMDNSLILFLACMHIINTTPIFMEQHNHTNSQDFLKARIMIWGWTFSSTNGLASFKNSTASNTTLVVPSPT